jgi:hypothetical protein
MFSPVATNDARQRGTQRSFAHHFYPLVSIPAFLGISLFVTAALMLSIVALILTAMLRFAIWTAGSLIFRSSGRSNNRQPALIRS